MAFHSHILHSDLNNILAKYYHIGHVLLQYCMYSLGFMQKTWSFLKPGKAIVVKH